jgi:class 3 adenylate cyclase
MLYTVLSAIGGITFLVARPQDVITILVQATAVYQFLMILVLGFLTLKTAVDFRRRVHATSNRRLYLALIPLLAVMTLTFVGDLYVRHEGLSFWPSEYLELILPLFSAGILLYVLSQADRKYQDERQRAQTLETEMTIERARTDLLSNFLSANLVQKFSDRKTMRENLREVLIPRPTRILVMQADIRGFSRITAQMDSVGMVQLLQSYYAQIVDTAQIVGQVKLIGDCIFLFVEESPAMAARDLADLGIELAALLSRETERLNEEARAVGNPVIRFGIAIHIGPAVVGNLSSNRCIDYTALGQNVNFVARLEELTKYPHVSAQVGDNGLIVSREASDALRRYSDLGLRRLDMDSGQVRVRSFEGTPDVLFLTAADLKKVGTGMLPTPTDGSKLR